MSYLPPFFQFSSHWLRILIVLHCAMFSAMFPLSAPAAAQTGREISGREQLFPSRPIDSLLKAASARPVDHFGPAGGHKKGGGTPPTLRDAAPEPSWIAKYSSHLAPAVCTPVAIVSDNSGNTYVTGASDTIGNRDDIVTVKYDHDGQVVWVARYNSPTKRGDVPIAMAIDAAGSIYITGYSYHNWVNDNTEILTLKYDNAGVLQWENHHDHGNQFFNGTPKLIKLDASGRAVVFAADEDGLALIILGADGSLVAEHNFVARALLSYTMAVSAAGDVYIAGKDSIWQSVAMGFNPDGTQRWMETIPGGASMDWYAENGIAVDSDQNIILVLNRYVSEESSIIRLRKLDPNGTELWSVEYNSPTEPRIYSEHLFVDGTGNLYLAGRARMPYDMIGDLFVAKFSSTGTPLWEQMYGRRTNDDSPIGASIDGDGNIFTVICSYPNTNFDLRSYEVLRFNSSGVRVWTATYVPVTQMYYDVPRGISADGTGGCVAMGTYLDPHNSTSYATSGYGADGQLRWSSLFTISSGYSDDNPASLQADREGNVIAAGTSTIVGEATDYCTVKIRRDGTLAWVQRYDGDAHARERCVKVLVDDEGCSYVCGTSQNANLIYDFLVVKYDRDGNQAWVARYDDPTDRDEVLSDAMIDSLGNVYLAGSTSNESGKKDILLVKVTRGGGIEWTDIYDSPYHWNDYAQKLAVDPAGYLDLMGTSYVTPYRPGCILMQYDLSGGRRWLTFVDSLGILFSTEMAISGAGEMAVTGTYRPDTVARPFLMHIGRDGNLQWFRGFGGDAQSAPSGGLAVDGEGNIISDTYYSDCQILRYSPRGEYLWSRYFPYRISTPPVADQSGFSYHLGDTYWNDLALGKYSPDGQQTWIARAEDPDAYWINPRSMILDREGSVVATGASQLSHAQEFFIVKYPQSPVFSKLTSSVQFEPVEVGCRATGTFEIGNTGAGTLLVDAITCTDSSYRITPLTADISALGSKTFTVTFSPLSGQQRNGFIIIHHNGASSPDTIPVSGTGYGEGIAAQYQRTYDEGWQLVSLPVRLQCPLVPGKLFAYGSGYTPCDTFSYGTGFWQKFTRSTEFATTGIPMPDDTFHLRAKWNLLGSLAQPVPAGNILPASPGTQITSAIYGYNHGYYAADTIQPGEAYWIKLNQAGDIGLHATRPAAIPDAAPSGKRSVIQSAAQILAASTGWVEFEDRTGYRQRLYLINEPVPVALRDMPPPPPGGMSVRFASNRLVASLSEGVMPLTLESLEYPVQVRWDCSAIAIPIVLSSKSVVTPLAGTGSIVLEKECPSLEIRSLAVQHEGRPLQFALEQAYPNPFNPSTVIRFSLAGSAHTSLVVFNTLGQEVARLVDEEMAAGEYSRQWNASNLPSGVYFYRLQTEKYSETRKLMIMK